MTHDDYADSPLRGGAAPEPWPWSDLRRAERRSLPTTLLVGNRHGIGVLRRRLRDRALRDYALIGCCLTEPGPVGSAIEGLPVLGGPDDVADVVHRYGVDTVAVLPSSGWNGAVLSRLEEQLRPTRAALLLGPAIAEPRGDRHPRRRGTGLHGVHALVKASFDRTAAALILLLLLPVFVAIAVGVKTTSRGPVFVGWTREGRSGRRFTMLRFRTTEVTAGRGVDGPAADRGGHWRPEAPGGATTPLGSLLRRHSLDELPQLLNVLRGDMALVGPRPGLPSSNALSDHRLRPGLIGLAPIDARPGRRSEEEVPTDVDYVENWSLLLDLTILRKTFAAALRGGRAA